jgi:hypothetical protein
VFIIGLCLTEGIFEEILFHKLSMDEAYLIMSNMNNSNTSIFLGNRISCEAFDLEGVRSDG